MPSDVVEIGRARGPAPAGPAGVAGNTNPAGVAGNTNRAGAPCPVAFFVSRIEAGFPSPADDYLEGRLDLNEHLIERPAATFFLRVSGDSMTGAGIYAGDILIVDRSIAPSDGKIVIAAVDGELTVKRLCRRGGQIRLLSENPRYPPININAGQDLHVWGVVIHAIHSFV